MSFLSLLRGDLLLPQETPLFSAKQFQVSQTEWIWSASCTLMEKTESVYALQWGQIKVGVVWDYTTASILMRKGKSCQGKH